MELFLIGVCRWVESAWGWVDCKDDEDDEQLPRGSIGGISCTRQTREDWRKWWELLMTLLTFQLLQGRLWAIRQGRGEVRDGEMLGLCCCPQSEASTWCQQWISDIVAWAQQLHLHTSSTSSHFIFQETQDISVLRWIFRSAEVVNVRKQARMRVFSWKRKTCFWSTSQHVLLIEKIVYFLSHLAPIFFFLWLVVCYIERWLAHPAVTHLVLQLVNIGFSRQGVQKNVISHGGGEPQSGMKILLVSGKCFYYYFPLVTLMDSCFMMVTVPFNCH